MRRAAQALQACFGAAEGNAVDRDLLNIDLQERREGQIPERGGHDDQVGLRELVRVAKARMIPLACCEKLLALGKIALFEIGQILRHEIEVLHAAVRRKGGQERVCEAFRPGIFAPDAAVDIENVPHACPSLSRR